MGKAVGWVKQQALAPLPPTHHLPQIKRRIKKILRTCEFMSRLGDSPGWPYSKQRKTGAIAQTAHEFSQPFNRLTA